MRKFGRGKEGAIYGPYMRHIRTTYEPYIAFYEQHMAMYEHIWPYMDHICAIYRPHQEHKLPYMAVYELYMAISGVYMDHIPTIYKVLD